MPRPPKDLTGKRFTRLTAIEISHEKKDGHHSFWKCRCDCGNYIVVRKDSLESGHAKSCGCMLEAMYRDGHLQTHGKSDTRLFSIFSGMKQRCYNEKSDSYRNYGGRGIRICDEWLNDFMSFYNWSIENGYDESNPGHNQSIDRIDVNGNYEPGNCRWATTEIQNYNKRDTQRVLICGEEKTLLEISREYEIPIGLVRSRYRRYVKGKCTIEQLLSKEKILSRPSNALYITVDGITKNLTEWENTTGVSRKLISKRYKDGARTKEELFRKDR